ncbi:response regulator [candidate division KSB1 bacterium]|nr:response regulator [candidate division KSB1 bacterium]
MESVMVVDDEQDIINLMSETLELWGYHAITAMDGEEAFEKFQENAVDLVITDLKLPKMNGVKLLDKLKNFENSTEVILFTGYPEVTSAIDAMKNGAFDYLVKPVDLAELKLKVERALEKKKMVKSIATLKGLNWAMIISIPLWLSLGILLAYLIKT